MIELKWFDAYHNLALKLKRIYNSEGQMSGSVLYSRIRNNNNFKSKVYDRSPLLKLPGSIDPINFFAFINNVNNKNEIKNSRYNQLLEIVDKELNIRNEQVIITDFRGCPAPKTSKIIVPRSFEEEVEIWNILSKVLDNGFNGINDKTFFRIKQMKGLDIPSFTMFLFWIDSKNFISLDNNMVSYLRSNNLLSSRSLTYQTYYELIQKTSNLDYIKLSIDAYNLNVNSLNYTSKTLDRVLEGIEVKSDSDLNSNIEKNLPIFKTPITREFKIIGLRVLEKTSIKWKRVIETDKIHKFSHAYDFTNKSRIKYDPSRDLRIFNVEGISISISAIVGKNGSGKSSIVDLIYIVLNNLSFRHPKITQEMKYVKDVYLDFYYSTEDLYCIELRGYRIKIKRFIFKDQEYLYKEDIEISNFNLEDLFYSISLNYAHFSLNSRHLGGWIEYLFHKNDSYQQPLVLNPHRHEGNINVNEEEGLANARLISNILFYDPEETFQEKIKTFRSITDKYTAEKIRLTYDSRKMSALYIIDQNTKDNPNKKYYAPWSIGEKIWLKFIELVIEVFDINRLNPSKSIKKSNSWIDVALKYILKKIINISRSYKKYENEFDLKTNEFKDLRVYLLRLKTDYSHVTYKLRQAINFLKFPHILKFIDPDLNKIKNNEIKVQALSKEIYNIINRNRNENLRTIDLIPPAFFKPEVLLTNDIELTQLSSGEKQRIYAVSTIGYHLINIDSSNSDEGMVSYKFANIIFDEIELYYHPEMQRTFIYYLLNYIKFLPIDLAGINMTFITHSPFILSDIPSDNIAFLGETKVGWDTYGANIHDMLSDHFFLDKGVMGENVKQTIISLTNFLTNPEVKNTMNWDRQSSWNVINILGEPLIKKQLNILWTKKYGDEDIEMEIKNLEKKLKSLKHAKNTKNRSPK